MELQIPTLAPYQKILEALGKLNVRWIVHGNGKGIRSEDGRCPLREFCYQQTGQDRMPTSEESGLDSRHHFTFAVAADNTMGCSPLLRKAILQATGFAA